MPKFYRRKSPTKGLATTGGNLRPEALAWRTTRGFFGWGFQNIAIGFRFVLGGIVNTGIGLALFALMSTFLFGRYLFFASFASYLAANMTALVLNRFWVFRSVDARWWNQLAKSQVIGLFILALNVGALEILVIRLSLHPVTAQFFFLLLSVPLQFFFNYRWAFNAKPSGAR